MSEHGSEIFLLGAIGIGCCILAGISAWHGSTEGAAAWSTVLMAIINAIKERWTSRSIDRMGQNLANAPPAKPPAEPTGES